MSSYEKLQRMILRLKEEDESLSHEFDVIFDLATQAIREARDQERQICRDNHHYLED